MKSYCLQNVFKHPETLKMGTLNSFREIKCVVFIFLFLIKTLKSIENDKKVRFGEKSFFFS